MLAISTATSSAVLGVVFVILGLQILDHEQRQQNSKAEMVLEQEEPLEL
jgi:Na+-translocating ferredoxin:NAD+ oxidoreductase RnfG subunit